MTNTIQSTLALWRDPCSCSDVELAGLLNSTAVRSTSIVQEALLQTDRSNIAFDSIALVEWAADAARRLKAASARPKIHGRLRKQATRIANSLEYKFGRLMSGKRLVIALFDIVEEVASTASELKDCLEPGASVSEGPVADGSHRRLSMIKH